MSGKTVLSEARDAEYAVFDDMQGGIKFFHGWKNWFGCQKQFSIKALYRDPQLLDWGKTMIWVTNTDPREEMKSHGSGYTYEDIDWLNANAIFVKVDKPLFFMEVEGGLMVDSQ